MKRTLHPPVFVASAAFTLITVIFAVAAPSSAQATFSAIQEWILRNASWVYILTVAIILLSVVFLAVSRYGDIKLARAVAKDSSLALFVFLEQLPLSTITSIIAIVMVIVFFVTSADSGALVVDLLASNGAENSPVWQRVFWSLLMGVVAIALLLADGLEALQTATIASALPFSIILLLALWGVFKALKLDATKRRIRYQTITRSAPPSNRESWRRRLRNIVMMPKRDNVLRFMNDIVLPAMHAVASELRQQGYDADVLEKGENDEISLEVHHHGEYMDFAYAVWPLEQVRPVLTSDELDNEDERRYFRAEVFLREGGQDYDIMGWSEEAVIGDILDQYERHRQYLHMVHGIAVPGAEARPAPRSRDSG
ncbi:BCCT family transporter [Alcaligenaceae bacterium]|nr:BCCT family transporter [Alcaligenaceae bacterium]